MAQDPFVAPCGCIWHGQEHYHQCGLWRKLAAQLKHLQGQPGTGQEVQRIKEQMDHHRRP
jgi:hypothetical protein